MTDIENRLIDYIKIADSIYTPFGALFSMTFMFGIIIHSAAQFAMRAYSDNMYFLQSVLFVSWTIVGLILIALSLNRPTAFYKRVKGERIGIMRTVLDVGNEGDVVAREVNVFDKE